MPKISPKTQSPFRPALHQSPYISKHTTIIVPSTPQPRLSHHAPGNNPSQPRTHAHQHTRSKISTVHQDLQRRDIIRNDRPAHGRCAARQVVVPYDQQYREELCAATDQQRGTERRWVRVVWYKVRVPGAQDGREFSWVEAGEEADWQVEGQGTESDEEQKEEVLEDEGLCLEDDSIGGRRCAGAVGGMRREREFLDACPREVDVEEKQEDTEAENGALGLN